MKEWLNLLNAIDLGCDAFLKAEVNDVNNYNQSFFVVSAIGILTLFIKAVSVLTVSTFKETQTR